MQIKDLTKEDKEKLAHLAVDTILEICNLNKVDFFSLPTELKKTLIEIYTQAEINTLDFFK